MNIFKKISLLGKIEKALKQAKQLIDENQGVAKDVKKVIKAIKADVETLIALLPSLKDVYLDILELIRNVKQFYNMGNRLYY